MSEIQQWVRMAAQRGIKIDPDFRAEKAADIYALPDDLLIDVINRPRRRDGNDNDVYRSMRKHRTLLRLFLNKWLEDERIDPVQPIYSVYGDPQSAEDIAERGFSPRMQPTRGMRIVGDIKTPEDWVSELVGWEPSASDDSEPVSVNLSNHYFIDSDAPAVEKIIEQLVRLLPGRVLRVNLEHNYFHGYYSRTRSLVDNMVTFLLDNSSVELLCLRDNPFSTSVRKDFFQELQISQLRKLVWLPPNTNPNDTRWQNVVVTDKQQLSEQQERIAAVAANISMSF